MGRRPARRAEGGPFAAVAVVHLLLSFRTGGESAAAVVPTAENRARLREWHERAGAGEELLVTDDGRPVVRVVAASADDVLARWEAAGILRRGRPRRPSAEIPVVPVPGESTDTISADREPWDPGVP